MMSPEIQYKSFCSVRFNSIQQRLDRVDRRDEEMSKSLNQIERKVFNGFGAAIKTLGKSVNSLRKLVFGLVAAIGLTGIALIIDIIFRLYGGN